jgi:hypothetical protein
MAGDRPAVVGEEMVERVERDPNRQRENAQAACSGGVV